MAQEDRRDEETIPTPSLWPAGFAVGVACALIGLVVSVPSSIIGLVVALVFGLLWITDSSRRASAPRDGRVGRRRGAARRDLRSRRVPRARRRSGSAP